MSSTWWTLCDWNTRSDSVIRGNFFRERERHESRDKSLKCMGLAPKKSKKKKQETLLYFWWKNCLPKFSFLWVRNRFPLGLLLYTYHPQRPCFMTSCTTSSFSLSLSLCSWKRRRSERKEKKNQQTEKHGCTNKGVVFPEILTVTSVLFSDSFFEPKKFFLR